MQMATYFGRLVGWYTAGGMTDECGHFHPSGLHYDWYGISVLNEDEHHIKPEDGVAYTVCYDAIKKEVAKVNPAVILVGPEIINGAPLQYMKYFLNASNHDDNEPPQIASYHWGTSTSGAQGAKFFTDWDAFLKSNVDPIGDFKRQLGSETELVLNEYANQFIVSFTENLLENTDGVCSGPPPLWGYPISVLSGRQPAASIYADGCSSDDVIAF